MPVNTRKSNKTAMVHSPNSNKKDKRPKNFYGVAAGWKVGIYDYWDGPGGGKENTENYKSNRFKGFQTLQDTIQYMEDKGVDSQNILIFLKNGTEMTLTEYNERLKDNDSKINHKEIVERVKNPENIIEPNQESESVKSVKRKQVKSHDNGNEDGNVIETNHNETEESVKKTESVESVINEQKVIVPKQENEYVKSVNNPENVQSVKNQENVNEPNQKKETVKSVKIQDSENVQIVKNPESVQSVKNQENVNNPENVQSVKNQENVNESNQKNETVQSVKNESSQNNDTESVKSPEKENETNHNKTAISVEKNVNEPIQLNETMKNQEEIQVSDIEDDSDVIVLDGNSEVVNYASFNKTPITKNKNDNVIVHNEALMNAEDKSLQHVQCKKASEVNKKSDIGRPEKVIHSKEFTVSGTKKDTCENDLNVICESLIKSRPDKAVQSALCLLHVKRRKTLVKMK